MNILCDFHHSDLWWSHHLIFEVGLGHKLYRPRGMEWLDRGYYRQTSRDVAKQFLVDSMFSLSDAQKYPATKIKMPTSNRDELRASMDTINGCPYYPLIRTLSFEEFADTKIHAIMATLSDNQEPWWRLRRDFKPTAKLIREEGNIGGWASLHPEYKNLITSDLPTFLKATGRNKVLYHQKFDMQRIFIYSKPVNFDRITCFMPGFRGEEKLVAFANQHNFGEKKFLDYGHYSKLGFLTPKAKYAEAMRETTFTWHVKPGGDGFGHVIHNSFAMGRPVITVKADYANSQVSPLLDDGETCVLIGGDPSENSKKIASFWNPEKIEAMSTTARRSFLKVVDYEAEERRIGLFLGSLER